MIIVIISKTPAESATPTLITTNNSNVKDHNNHDDGNHNSGIISANIKILEKKSPNADYAMGVRDGRIGDARVLVRGEIRNQGQTVKRGFPQVMDVVKAYPISSRSSGRLQLANWLTQPDNPLTSRVMANRIWHHLCGSKDVTNRFKGRVLRPTIRLCLKRGTSRGLNE